MKSELNYKDRYEVADKINCTPATNKDLIITIVVGVVFGVIAVLVMASLFTNFKNYDYFSIIFRRLLSIDNV